MSDHRRADLSGDCLDSDDSNMEDCCSESSASSPRLDVTDHRPQSESAQKRTYRQSSLASDEPPRTPSPVRFPGGASSGCTRSGSKDSKNSQSSDSGHPASVPTAFRPGRLNNVEILERIFPMQKKHVLELVLQGCNGDLVKAIEQFIAVQDTYVAQQQQSHKIPLQQQHALLQQHMHMLHMQQQQVAAAVGRNCSDMPPHLSGILPPHPFTSVAAAAAANRLSLAAGSSSSAANMKSAFSNFTSFNGLHSAFSPRAAAFTTDALLGRTPPHPAVTAANGISPGIRPPPSAVEAWLAAAAAAASGPPGFPYPPVGLAAHLSSLQPPGPPLPPFYLPHMKSPQNSSSFVRERSRSPDQNELNGGRQDSGKMSRGSVTRDSSNESGRCAPGWESPSLNRRENSVEVEGL